MTLTHRKLVSLEFTPEGPRGVVEYHTTFLNAPNDVLPLIGGYQGAGGGGVSWVNPASLAELPGIHVVHVALDYILGTDADTSGYQDVKVTAEYGTTGYVLDARDGNMFDHAIIQFAETVEGVSLPKSTYTWSSGTLSGQTLGDGDITPQKLIPFLTLDVNWKFTPSADLNAFAMALQKPLNNAVIQIRGLLFAAGQVLFQGVTGDPATSADGVQGYSRQIKLACRLDDWNKVYCATSNTFETVTPLPYPTSDISQTWADLT